jgi:8-oxo-dGTP pyrophosphatase MutT (NUDIX family)
MPESPSSADRAVRALADAVGDSRPRLPGDGTDPDIPVAATVVILRDGPAGPEVLMIERPDRGSFAGAWVFPGGKLDPADAGADDEIEEQIARRAGVRETWEETGLTLEQGGLVTLSCWDPPPGLPLRIRTWFFAAPAPAGELALSADEAVAADWVRPGDLLERHSRGEVTLYPPTWITLHGLSAQPSVAALLAAIRLAGVHRFETVARRVPSGPMLLWQEDAEYETDAAAEASEIPGAEASARHRLEVGALPWIYTRTS